MTLKIHMITKKGLNFKNFELFWVNSNFSLFFGQNWIFRNFCDFFKFGRFSTPNTEIYGCRWALGFYFIWKKLFNLSFPGSNLFVRKIFAKLLNFEKMSKNRWKFPILAIFGPILAIFDRFWPFFSFSLDNLPFFMCV